MNDLYLQAVPIVTASWNWLVLTGPRLLLIAVVALVVMKLGRMASRRLFKIIGQKDSETCKRADTLSSVLSALVTIATVVVALIMILEQLGVSISAALATVGIVGVAIGLGSQHIVRDMITGFFILLDDQIRVGDVVEVAGKGGLVERVGLRMTVLRDLRGNVHFVPNSEIKVVTNMTKVFSCYLFDIGVAYREDVDEVMQVMRQVDENMRQDPQFKDDILDPIEVLGVDQFANSAVVIRARTKTKPLRQWAVGREFNRRLKKRFDELDIEIPFPHVTMYMGKDKQGGSPPLNVTLEQQQATDRFGHPES